MSTIKVNNIDPPNVGEGVSINGLQMPTDGPLSNRNRIINGDMRIDQRNSGAAVTSGFPLDRWQIELFSGGGAANVEQVVDSPTDSFYYSMKVDVTTADTSLAAGDVYTIRQIIEGNNIVDLRYGLTGAKTVTVSFWVKSNVTGTFCAALRNGGNDRCKPKEYTISSANTWEQKTLTFTGDTSGTWGTDNGRGIQLSFCLGSGTTFQGTVDTWNASEVHCTSNQTNLFASTSNEWYVTGVQLEVGSKATPFEHRSYGDELARCKRYYQRYTDLSFRHYVANVIRYFLPLDIELRANPVSTVYSFTGTVANNNTVADTEKITIDIQRDPAGSTGVMDLQDGTITLDSEL
jgi:hypothetical protein